jgi:peptidoglycan/LPS O-acetylase OafA/YrhL
MKKHFEALDGLRGVAAISVVAYHAGHAFGVKYLFPRGYLAVDFFFALSGFVIATAYERRLLAGWSFKNFAITRMLRLWPLIALGTILGSFDAILKWKLIGTPDLGLILLATAAGLLMLPINTPASPVPNTLYAMNPPAWSLLFEIIANAAYALSIRRITTTYLGVILALSAIGLIVYAIIARDISDGGSFDNAILGLARVGFSFTAGVLLYRVKPILRIPSFVAVILLIAIFFVPRFHGGWAFDLACIFVALPLIVSGAIEAKGGALCRLSGRISYPIYATHSWSILMFTHWIRAHHLAGGPFAIAIAAEVATAIGIGVVAMLLDERLQAKLKRNVAPILAATG